MSRKPWNTDYPASIDDAVDDFSEVIDGDVVLASHANALAEAVINLQQVVGLPDGSIPDSIFEVVSSLESNVEIVRVNDGTGGFTDTPTATDSGQLIYLTGGAFTVTLDDVLPNGWTCYLAVVGGTATLSPTNGGTIIGSSSVTDLQTLKIWKMGDPNTSSSWLVNVVSDSAAWTSNNDGPGSGLNADLLDGQEGSFYASATDLSTHVADFANPHNVTPAQIGAEPTLGFTPEDSANKGVANGYASLDANAKVPPAQLPGLALTDVHVVGSEAAQIALVAEEGDVAIRTDLNRSYVHNGGTAGTMADWNELLTPTDAVLSVDGRTGIVTLSDLYEPNDPAIQTHISSTSNPHAVTAAQVGAPTTATFNDHSTRHELGGADELSLDATQVATGILDEARIPNISGNKIAQPFYYFALAQGAHTPLESENGAVFLSELEFGVNFYLDGNGGLSDGWHCMVETRAPSDMFIYIDAGSGATISGPTFIDSDEVAYIVKSGSVFYITKMESKSLDASVITSGTIAEARLPAYLAEASLEAAYGPTSNIITGTTYTVDDDDHDDIVSLSNAGLTTVTLNDSVTVGVHVFLSAYGAGGVTLTAGGSAIIDGDTTLSQGDLLFAYKADLLTWITRTIHQSTIDADLFNGQPASFYATTTDLNTHIADSTNPHNVTAAQVGAPTTTTFNDHSARHELGGADVLSLDASQIATGVLSDDRLTDRIGPLADFSADLNTAISNGWYRTNSSGLNTPTASSYLVHVMVAINTDWVTQTAHEYTADSSADTKTWRRERNGGTWGSWYRLKLSQEEQEAVYLNASNINAGTLAEARLPGYLAQAALDASYGPTSNIIAGTTYTVDDDDHDDIVSLANVGLTTVTLTDSVTVGVHVFISAYGAGGVSLVAGGTAILEGSTSLAQGDLAFAYKADLLTWIIRKVSEATVTRLENSLGDVYVETDPSGDGSIKRIDVVSGGARVEYSATTGGVALFPASGDSHYGLYDDTNVIRGRFQFVASTGNVQMRRYDSLGALDGYIEIDANNIELFPPTAGGNRYIFGQTAATFPGTLRIDGDVLEVRAEAGTNANMLLRSDTPVTRGNLYWDRGTDSVRLGWYEPTGVTRDTLISLDELGMYLQTTGNDYSFGLTSATLPGVMYFTGGDLRLNASGGAFNTAIYLRDDLSVNHGVLWWNRSGDDIRLAWYNPDGVTRDTEMILDETGYQLLTTGVDYTFGTATATMGGDLDVTGSITGSIDGSQIDSGTVVEARLPAYLAQATLDTSYGPGSNFITGTSYTIDDDDHDDSVFLTNAGLTTITLTNTVTPGVHTFLYAYGAGGVSLVAGGTATLEGETSLAQGEIAFAVKADLLTWVIKKMHENTFDASRITGDGAGSGLDADLLDGQQGSFYQNATNINAGTLAEARLPSTAWTSNNDGSGSGLDADLLDGQQGSFYQNASNLNAGTVAEARLPAYLGQSALDAAYQAAYIASRTVTGTTDTIVASDNGKTIYYTNAGFIGVTVTAGLTTGTKILLSLADAAGAVSLSLSGGETFANAASVLAGGDLGYLEKIGATTWVMANTYDASSPDPFPSVRNVTLGTDTIQTSDQGKRIIYENDCIITLGDSFSSGFTVTLQPELAGAGVLTFSLTGTATLVGPTEVNAGEVATLISTGGGEWVLSIAHRRPNATTAAFNLTLSDANCQGVVRMDSDGAARTVTVPDTLLNSFQCTVVRDGTNSVTITSSGSMTLVGPEVVSGQFVIDEDFTKVDLQVIATNVCLVSASMPYYESGTWTPTVTAGTNVDSASGALGNYVRIGGRVICSVRINIDATSTGDAIVLLDPPIATDFTSNAQATGHAGRSGSGYYGFCYADAVSDDIGVRVQTQSAIELSWWVFFMYRV